MKFIFLDIDDTLFDHRINAIPNSAMIALSGAKTAGHKIFICTGRSYCQLGHVKNINYDGVICSSGAYIRANDKLLFEENIKPEDVSFILEQCHRFNIACNLEGLNGIYMEENAKKLFFERLKLPEEAAEGLRRDHHFTDISLLTPGEKIYKITMFCRELSSFERLGVNLGNKFNLIVTTKAEEQEDAKPLSAELTLSCINKATGIRKIVEYYKADMADTISVGDSMNDIEMIEECKVGIAMGNADSRLKASADFVTSDIGRDGLFKAFMKYHLL